jgi:hypothetical protein
VVAKVARTIALLGLKRPLQFKLLLPSRLPLNVHTQAIDL